MMKRSCTAALAALMLAAPFVVEAQTSPTAGYDLSDYRVNTTESLIDICTLPSSHYGYDEARSFCFGFIAGIGQYHRALADAAETKAIFCPPETVTRSDVVNTFVDFVKANPQYQMTPPVETLVRALDDKWPCKN